MATVPARKRVIRKNSVEKVYGASPLTRVLVMLLVPLVVGVLIACGNSSGGSQGGTTTRAAYEGVPEGKPPGLAGSVPDPKEVIETKPAGQLPDFLETVLGPAKETVASLYQGAAEHHADFAYIPCYCGCAIYEHPHSSLKACFIKAENADGSLDWTDHSTTCSQCQEAAQMTIDGNAQGTPLKDIRSAVFSKLNYTGIWTDTPPVP